jgi:hypothetical protein
MLIDGGDGSLYWATSYISPCRRDSAQIEVYYAELFGMRKAAIDYGPRYTGGEEYLDLH